MSVVSSIESVGPCRKKVHIEVPTPAVEAETMRVVKEYGKRIKLPGFRKGRVPPAMVQARFRSEIEQEVLDRLVPRYWKQAEAESSLEPLLPPNVEAVELREGEPLTFVATVEVRPEIVLASTEGFDLPEADIEPTGEELDEAVDSLRARVADWVTTDRAAARGDLVSMELQEIDDETATPGEIQRSDVEVGDPRVWEELSLALTGLEKGQETDFRRQEETEEESRVRHFRVRALEVKERDLPPLDDAFAKKVGDFEGLEALRDQITESLRQEKETARRVKREQALLEQLRERNPLELPSGVVEEEVRQLLREYAQGLAQQGVDPENIKIDWESLAQEVRPQAERRVHARLLLDAVADEAEIEVEPQEFEARLAELAKAQGRTTVALRQALAQSGQLDGMRRQMRREKTIRQLLASEGGGEASAAEK